MITIDGINFDVPVISLKRKSDPLYKFAERNQSGDAIFRLLGQYYNFSISFGTTYNVAEYNRLWDKLTEAVVFHEVKVPNGDGWYIFKAYFSGVEDELILQTAKKNYFGGLKAEFIAKIPAKRP